MKKMILAAFAALGLAACSITGPSAGDLVNGQVVQYDGSLVNPVGAPAGTILRKADQRCTVFGKFLWDETAFPECKLDPDEKPLHGYIVRK